MQLASLLISWLASKRTQAARTAKLRGAAHQRRVVRGHQGSTAPLGLAVDHILYQKQQAAELGSSTRAVNTRLQSIPTGRGPPGRP